MNKLKNIFLDDGFLGVIEKAFFVLRKYLFTFYYQFRFKSFGRGSVVLGPIRISGGKKITIGCHVVISEGTEFRVSGNSYILVRDECFLGRDSLLISEGELSIGRKVYLLQDSRIFSGRRVSIGDKVWIARDCSVGGEDVILEKDVILGPSVSILGSDHHIDSVSGEISMKSGKKSPVLLKQNAWIGTKSIVLKGVTIGRSTIIGAGSVVTKDIDEHCLAAGVPAVFKKKLIDSTTFHI
ncbi:MAG: hypothetical protein HZC17_06635 [Candidatus Omnitrophica bacterium]|nr:hypothetical protein [Candidatus Omnitrophota bacterium]